MTEESEKIVKLIDEYNELKNKYNKLDKKYKEKQIQVSALSEHLRKVYEYSERKIFNIIERYKNK